MESQFIVTSYQEPINLAWTKVSFRLIQSVTDIDLHPPKNETGKEKVKKNDFRKHNILSSFSIYDNFVFSVCDKGYQVIH